MAIRTLRHALPVALLTLVVGAGLSSSSFAVSIAYESQERRVGANSNAESESASAADFAPFDATVLALGVGPEGEGGGSASATQRSGLDATKIDALLTANDFGSPSASSFLEVEFSLSQSTSFRLDGSVDAGIDGSNFLFLEQIGGGGIYDSRVDPTGGAAIDLAGLLAPGRYRVIAEAEAIGNTGFHRVAFTLMVPEPGTATLAWLGLAIACAARRSRPRIRDRVRTR